MKHVVFFVAVTVMWWASFNPNVLAQADMPDTTNPYLPEVNPDGWSSLSVGITLDLPEEIVEVSGPGFSDDAKNSSRVFTAWGTITAPVNEQLTVFVNGAFTPEYDVVKYDIGDATIRRKSKAYSVTFGLKIFFPKKNPNYPTNRWDW